MNDSIRITRGIPHNIQNFGEFSSFDLCITQGLVENVGSVTRMAKRALQEKRVLWSETPDDQGKDRSDEVLLCGDEEVLNYFETIFVCYVHC